VPCCVALTAKSALVLGRLRGNDNDAIPGTGALFAMQDTRWDHGLRVTGDGQGVVGYAGAVLLRKLADRCGLTAALGPALARAGKSPLVDRGSRWCRWRSRSRLGSRA
jgi:hypothetical protein